MELLDAFAWLTDRSGSRPPVRIQLPPAARQMRTIFSCCVLILVPHRQPRLVRTHRGCLMFDRPSSSSEELGIHLVWSINQGREQQIPAHKCERRRRGAGSWLVQGPYFAKRGSSARIHMSWHLGMRASPKSSHAEQQSRPGLAKGRGEGTRYCLAEGVTVLSINSDIAVQRDRQCARR